MAPNPARGRLNLRQGLDRDVYSALKKLEDANDGKPFKRVGDLYDAIKRSNSSLSRQKKRPLEDSIERVLQFRKEELDESEDSEAAIEELEQKKPEDERFLLNRQMTKLWHQDSGTSTPANERRATKKRRIDEDGDDRDARLSGSESAAANAPRVNGAARDVQATDKPEKTSQKKAQRSARFKVEQLSQPILLAGVDEIRRQLLHQARPLLKWHGLYAENNWYNSSGILLSGPSGTGKKSLVRSLAAELDVPLISVAHCLDDPERMDKSLTEAVDEAMRLAPSILFVEQLDWYMSRPGGGGFSDHHRRVVTQFMRQMERMAQEQPKDRPVLAMATTSRLADVDPAVLKTGLFEETVMMRVPDSAARRDIFELLVRDIKTSDDLDYAKLAKMTHGFVGADIFNIVKRAQKAAAERAMSTGKAPVALLSNGEGPMRSPEEALEAATHEDDGAFSTPPIIPLEFEDFADSIQGFTPTLRKEGFTVIPNVTWDQVGALHRVREQLETSIIGPIKNPDLFQAFGVKRPAGVLLWGPPGCGKTLVAQAVANEAQASFILINGPELLNKYVGESERAIRELFQRARSSTPCILFFDEMDSLVPRRDSASTDAGARVVNALLTELDGAQDRSGIYVIGTTNRPDMIDAAMLRPGRLSERLFVDLPTEAERAEILAAVFRTCHARASVGELARLRGVASDARCADFSGADLDGLHTKAAQHAVNRWLRREKLRMEIDGADWEHALANSRRSVLNPESYRKLEGKLEGKLRRVD